MSETEYGENPQEDEVSQVVDTTEPGDTPDNDVVDGDAPDDSEGDLAPDEGDVGQPAAEGQDEGEEFPDG